MVGGCRVGRYGYEQTALWRAVFDGQVELAHPNVWRHSDWEFSIILEHLPFLSGKSDDTASAACPAHPGNLEMISMILAAVICDADDPCSVNTA